MTRPVSLRLLPVLPAIVLGLATLSGCGGGKSDKLELVPVSGKITYADGSPVPAGMVTFTPDEAKGNKGKASPTGAIDATGAYTVKSEGRDGAPVGWYKVAVGPAMGGMGGMQAPSGDPGVVSDPNKAMKSANVVNFKYQSPGTSGLSVEVTAGAAAGAYDFKVSK